MTNTTLLTGVNDVLKRMGVIKGNSGALTSLTDSQRQVVVDLTVQMWNEVTVDLYTTAQKEVPGGIGSSTITLATGTRAYAMASDVVRLRWPLQDTTNGRYISEYPGGYAELLHDQPIPAAFTGLPLAGAIRPTDNYIYLDTVPTSAENGKIYTYLYDKTVTLSLASDTFPFSNEVYALLISPVAELVKSDREKNMNGALYKLRMAQAAALVSEVEPRLQWIPDRQTYENHTDPLEE